MRHSSAHRDSDREYSRKQDYDDRRYAPPSRGHYEKDYSRSAHPPRSDNGSVRNGRDYDAPPPSHMHYQPPPPSSRSGAPLYSSGSGSNRARDAHASSNSQHERASYSRPSDRQDSDRPRAAYRPSHPSSSGQPSSYERDHDDYNRRRARDDDYYNQPSTSSNKRPRYDDDDRRPNGNMSNRRESGGSSSKQSHANTTSNKSNQPPAPLKASYERDSARSGKTPRISRRRSRSRSRTPLRSRRSPTPDRSDQDDRYLRGGKRKEVFERERGSARIRRTRRRSITRSPTPLAQDNRTEIEEEEVDDRFFARRPAEADMDTAEPDAGSMRQDDRPGATYRSRSRTRSASLSPVPAYRNRESRDASQMDVDGLPARPISNPPPMPDRASGLPSRPASATTFSWGKSVKLSKSLPPKPPSTEPSLLGPGFKRAFAKEGLPKKPVSQVKKFFPDEDDESRSVTQSPVKSEGKQGRSAQTPLDRAEDEGPAPPPMLTPSPKAPPPESFESNDVPEIPTNGQIPAGAEEDDKYATGRSSQPQTPVAAQLVVPPPPREVYERLTQVGEGTYGKVYKARNTEDDSLVALKRIRMEAEKDGFPVTSVREIKLLQSLRHPNVINLSEIMVSHGSVYMVFDYMDHDLTGVLRCPEVVFEPSHLKSLMSQLLHGLAYIHNRGVLHRDLKGSNVLLDRHGVLKIADFGLARFYAKNRKDDYTNRVITQWYKPPELLYGATVYGAEVDIWSAGCILLELHTKRPVFQGQDEIHQLDVIFKITGTPDQNLWPELPDLPWYELVKPRQTLPNRFREAFAEKWLKTEETIKLAESLLSLNPAGRPTANKALSMPYFTSELPLAQQPTMLSSIIGDWHELEAKALVSKRKAQVRKEEKEKAKVKSASQAVASEKSQVPV